MVALSIGFGMIPLVSPTLFHNAPEMLRTLLDSGILIASVVAVSLNAYFNVGTPAASHGPVVIADQV